MKILKVTRAELVKTYGEDAIIAKVFNIPRDEIGKCLDNSGYKIKNTLRVDNHPSLGMKLNRGKIYIHDFANATFRGDIFNILGVIYHLRCDVPYEFKTILIKTLSLMKNEDTETNLFNTKLHEVKKSTVSVIEYDVKPFSRNDIRFWLNYITTDELKAKNVRAAKNIRINNISISTLSPYEPIYAYTFGEYDNVKHIEIYAPTNTIKFRTNFQRLKIPPDLRGNSNLILIKSYKDLIILDKILITSELPFDLIATPSENYIIPKQQVDALYKHYTHIYVFADFDTQGITSLLIHNYLYDFEPISYVNDYFELDDIDKRGIINILANKEIEISNSDIDEFILILRELEIHSEYKDVYDNMKYNRASINNLIKHLKSKM